MLLQHAWLAPLLKPQTIAEEDEEDEEDAENGVADLNKEEEKEPGVVDKEVADWVKGAIERRRAGKMGKKEKPALHAAPLDAVVSPGVG